LTFPAAFSSPHQTFTFSLNYAAERRNRGCTNRADS
jgi:hypothetical protein